MGMYVRHPHKIRNSLSSTANASCYSDACVHPLSHCTDLEWKIIYVGSAATEDYDQVLDSILVGPVPAGRHMFVFQVRHH